jgi:hypothetical protein
MQIMSKEKNNNILYVRNKGLEGVEFSFGEESVKVTDIDLLDSLGNHLLDYVDFHKKAEEVTLFSELIITNIDDVLSKCVEETNDGFVYNVGFNYSFVLDSFNDEMTEYDHFKTVEILESNFNKATQTKDIFFTVENDVKIYTKSKDTATMFLEFVNDKFIIPFLIDIEQTEE